MLVEPRVGGVCQVRPRRRPPPRRRRSARRERPTGRACVYIKKGEGGMKSEEAAGRRNVAASGPPR